MRAGTMLAAAGLLAASACGPTEPHVDVHAWSLSRDASGKSYALHLDAVAYNLGNGFYIPTVRWRDERGCRAGARLQPVAPPASSGGGGTNMTQSFAAPYRIAEATLSLVYVDPSNLIMDPPPKFVGTETVDAMLRPPATPPGACSAPAGKPPPKPKRPTMAKLRERARTDPEGADAAAIDSMSREEMVATAINTAGFLCARVTSLRPDSGGIVASCIEYRSGEGRVTYRIDPRAGTVVQLE